MLFPFPRHDHTTHNHVRPALEANYILHKWFEILLLMDTDSDVGEPQRAHKLVGDVPGHVR